VAEEGHLLRGFFHHAERGGEGVGQGGGRGRSCARLVLDNSLTV
jgi:hypothetical protein